MGASTWRFPKISIHALQTECDCTQHLHMYRRWIFLSTHSKRSATSGLFHSRSTSKFLSTHSKRSATMSRRMRKILHLISIHALQTECDLLLTLILRCLLKFLSTHSKRSATIIFMAIREICLFLSTHSKRSATIVRMIRYLAIKFLSTHSKRSATRKDWCYCVISWFLSTHSKRSATESARYVAKYSLISIHALQTECDSLIKNMLIYGFLEYKFANNFKNTN